MGALLSCLYANAGGVLDCHLMPLGYAACPLKCQSSYGANVFNKGY